MIPLYCITGRNRLTSERAIISEPMIRKEAEEKRLEYNMKPAYSRPYTHTKLALFRQTPSVFDNKK